MTKSWFVVNVEKGSCLRRVNKVSIKKEDFLTSRAGALSADLLGSVLGTTKEKRVRRLTYSVICASCGKEAEVPFQPRLGRPVYCNECYVSEKRMR